MASNDDTSLALPGAPWRLLAELTVPSEPGNERIAMDSVAEVLLPLGLPLERVERLKLALAEAALNAMEHGTKFQAEQLITIRVFVSDRALRVEIRDEGDGGPIPALTTPDLDAKLAGEQSPRGWGFFLMQRMVDGMRITSAPSQHTIELLLFLEGGERGESPA